MTIFDDLLATVARGADPGPFALLRRDGRDRLDVLIGPVTTVDRLADIPLPHAAPAGPATLAVVPYRQIAERGFACVDDGSPLECLRVSAYQTVSLPRAVAALPDAAVTNGGGFDRSDEEYAETVGAVLAEEIGRGEGANFVIHRVFESTVDGDPRTAALAVLRRLLVGERGAYWTFLVHTGARTLVGATPERHVTVSDGLVMMNPISGTHRHGPAGPDRAALLAFLADPKEVDELYTVLDEELKMMATVADAGGRVIGPYLKEMSRLAHTEYLLAGQGTRDVREVLRETMFAPTVTGSPIENACRVIARRECRGRRYYAGVLALLGHDDAGRQTLDAPILIRTAEITPDGVLRVPVGATLVRHSTPTGEVAETHTKAVGVLAALGLGSAAGAAAGAAAAGSAAGAAAVRFGDDPSVRAALAARNAHLARFWLDPRAPGELVVPALAGRRAVIVDGEDTFTGMLAHLLRALGLAVTVRPYDDPGDVDAADLVVAGPGPGDPTGAEPNVVALRGLVAHRLAHGRPLLAVCLGHQMLADALGLRLHRRAAPYQGLQREIDLFGRRCRVGFYSTFTALSDVDRVTTEYGEVDTARDAMGGAVHALRGPTFAGVQFHAESVLTEDGVGILRDLITALLPARPGGGPPLDHDPATTRKLAPQTKFEATTPV